LFFRKEVVSAAENPQDEKNSFPLMPGARVSSLILAMVLLALTGIMGLATVQRMKNSREWVLHTYQVRGLLKDLRADIGESHANFDLYQLSRNPEEVRDLERQSQEQLGIIEQLVLLTVDNPAQLQRLTQFRRVLLEDIQQLRDCVNGANCLGTGPASASDKMTVIYQRRQNMRAMLTEMENLEERLLSDRLGVLDRLFTRMVITLIVSFVLALGLLLYNVNLLNRDIQRGKRQEWIEKKNAESYRMLSARILELQDMERRKIARELHDSVGQFLAGLKLNLGRLQRTEPGTQRTALLGESLELTERAIVEMRTISHLLHPPLLDELGFHAAVRWYTEGFAKRSGIEVKLQLTEIVQRLPKEVELALFRVLQESLTNVHRHAKATRVEVNVECTDHDVILLVGDDGKGISWDVLQRFRAGEAGGIGLAGMRERLAELGGTLFVESGPEGTQVRARLPRVECTPKDHVVEDVTITPG
jgi:signal transduction histidine kinase